MRPCIFKILNKKLELYMKFNKIKLITLVFTFIIGTINNGNAQPPANRSPLSYSKTILNPEYKKAFENDLNKECFDLLYNHYKKGGNLFCKSLSEIAVPLDYFSENPNLYLYHYTKSNIPYEIFHSNISLNEKLNEFFKFFRKRFGEDSSPYFASDSKSSQSFGNFLIRLKMKPNAKILLNKNTNAVDQCSNELALKINNFNDKCKITFFDSYARPDAQKLALMILEDSGIALFDYHYGRFAENHKQCKPNLEESWLQLTGPEWILDAESFDLNKY